MSEGTAVSPIPQSGPKRARVAVMYGAMVVAAIGLFLTIDSWGSRLVAPERTGTVADEPVVGRPKTDALPHVLLALTAVVIVGRLLGLAFRYVGQPPVIGEVVGGLVLGPSLLGWIWPEATAFLLPPSVAPFLGVIAQLGVILYMFLIGLELNLDVLRKRAHAAVAISHTSIIAPFLLGTGLALFLYPRFSSREVPFTSFALFLGVAMAITAFPVLARILTDRGMQTSRLGVIALACAATDDVTAWCLLAFVVGVAQAQVGGALLVVALTIGYIAFMVFVARPTVGRYLGRLDESQLTPGTIALVFVGLLLSTLTTEAIGVHAIFGAFLFGAMIPHDSPLSRALTHKLEDLVTILLLPAFFAFTGMRTRIGLVSGIDQWLVCGLIILVATAGKFGGTYAAARLTGLARRDSAALGILMNTRGLMELIVLNIGLDMKVISPTLFAMMVLMALATTLATTPILHWLATLAPRPARAPTTATP
ncbi:MAG TPA: cation:proton antiporter [Planctomycetaceae bacterium]|nr:cation:proton antiporter [Planctomycetaceae bacterium]